MVNGPIEILHGPDIKFKIQKHFCMTACFGTLQKNFNGLTKDLLLNQNKV